MKVFVNLYREMPRANPPAVTPYDVVPNCYPGTAFFRTPEAAATGAYFGKRYGYIRTIEVDLGEAV